VEALLLGLDCVTIAGTGSRKTMPFAMPLLVDRTKKKIVLVISSLNDLEDDQVILFWFRWSLLLEDITLGPQI
jgi:superfamily II DNA/RNA helicase